MRLIDIDALDWEEVEAEHGKRNGVVVDCETLIESAPIVNLWIPCSERLPEEDGEYLIWCVSYDVSTGDKITITNAYGISYYDTQFGAWTGVHVGGFLWNEVVAWMPLPKPYFKAETTTDREGRDDD